MVSPAALPQNIWTCSKLKILLVIIKSKIYHMLTRIILCVLVVAGFSRLLPYNRQQISAEIGTMSVILRQDQDYVWIYSETESPGLQLSVMSRYYGSLHSHEVHYPRGSGHQSVTGMVYDNDYNSLWSVREPHNEPVKTYSTWLISLR